MLQCIPDLVPPYGNIMLIVAPNKEEIKEAIFSISTDFAPSTDGFSSYFLYLLLGYHSR